MGDGKLCYPLTVMELECPMAEVHRVRSDGTIKFNMRREFISTSLADQLVGLHQLDERYVRVVFADLVLGLGGSASPAERTARARGPHPRRGRALAREGCGRTGHAIEDWRRHISELMQLLSGPRPPKGRDPATVRRMRTPLLFAILAAACGGTPKSETVPPPAPDVVTAPATPVVNQPLPVQSDPLVEEAKKFAAEVDKEARRVIVAAAETEWANETDITDAHEAAAAKAAAEQNIVIARLIKQARKYEPILGKLDASTRRQIQVLIYQLTVDVPINPSPEDPKQADELAKIAAEMTSIYGKGKVCANPKDPKSCKDLDALSKVLQKSRKPAELLAAWQGWHDTIGRAERDDFARYVGLANAGAKSLGFADISEMWKGGYDMPAADFAKETDRLWGQVKPFYEQLHCYTRRKLNKMYGDKVVGKTGPIPAHLLGNMWAQTWDYLYPELEPYKGEAKIDVTPALAKSYDPTKMMKMGESFYTSLGMNTLPDTFWTRSMLTKPPGKDVVCHASSWDVEYNNDLRIKMCTEKNEEDLITIHHELGHSYYFTNYYKLPIVLQNGANDGFHEAIGDTIALSMTPSYFKERGLLDKVVKNDKATINAQMHKALEKIAFLPFGLMVDRWRWDAFSGAVAPAQYNQHWWDLKLKYQGVSPPVKRADSDFDPGAKFHVASNTPYMRYFLAAVLQFQFHRAMCHKAGFTGPLNECSIYNNKDAGAAFQKMLALGASVPWQQALESLTGEKTMDASAILEYFAPLQAWLVDQNKGESCGW